MDFAQDIQGSLDSANFIKLVRPLCVLTQGASSFISDADILFQGYNQFNNIGLVLSAAKAKDNTQLFKVPTTYQAVLELMTNSAYTQGLINVAAELAAANIIRSLPLNDSLKLIDRGNALETRAYSNLDRIIFLYTSGANATTTSIVNTGTEYFFFAPALDKSTIPESSFDVDLETEISKIEGVKVVENITVNPNHISFIYFNILKSEPGTPPLLNEGATVVSNLEPIESLAFRLASDINNLCTDVYTTTTNTYPFSNLIAAPTRTINRDTNVSIRKTDLYPDTTTFTKKIVGFTSKLYSVYIEFSARRLSTIVSTEAIIIRPITIHKGSLLNSYKGDYLSTTTYNINDIVVFNNIAYKSLQNNNTNNPVTNTASWQIQDLSNITYTLSDLVLRKNRYFKDSIDGLLVGKVNNTSLQYSALQPQGPLSALIDVNRGVSTSALAASTAKASSIDHKVEIDTFYFGFADPLNPFCIVAGRLKFRISTLSPDAPWVDINISIGDKPEDVAFKLVQGILEYRVAQDTHVVGAQIYNNAVYINAYKITNPEVKVVVDIKFETMEGITVSAYYHLQAPSSTTFSASPRSVAVTTVLRILTGAAAIKTNPDGITKGASIVTLDKNRNSLLSKAYDKIGILNDTTGNQNVWNRSNMY